jgi:hypothetical protein
MMTRMSSRDTDQSRRDKRADSPEVLEKILEHISNMTREELIESMRPPSGGYLPDSREKEPPAWVKHFNQVQGYKSLLRWCYEKLDPESQEMLGIWEPWVKTDGD